ncbi:hypothetical protein ASPZODRAFT_135808 [Penicilliopsis zonata CBS 506.65]|uniref:75k gamma secalin n=1 Tax=Penicilliopsis zonata CBS 506.65 TaxID=1073090 RepID=A0A1L9S9C5_9EURO|nr:hypothetical protein ASPZODRAFT_135808 [Penicilliopsis zonata CBS 506.65]OJJ43782.1 hypothetical protein ASPZODRAFT_135808 [Penicilliopsis zonata CBS 506.65]
MSYPPPHNGHYPPQYLQQPTQQQQLPPPPLQPPPPPQQQLPYNGAPNIPPFHYGKPVMYPQVMVPTYNAYAQAYNAQRPPHPPPQQFVNPAVFQQSPVHTSPSSQFIHGSPTPAPIHTQYGRQPAVSMAGTAVPTTGASTPSAYYSTLASNGSVPVNQSTPKPLPQTTSLPRTPVPKPTGQPQQRPIATPATRPTPNPPSRPVPQVLVPALSPEVRQKMQQSPQKKRVQKPQSQQQVAEKPGKPPVDYQVLLLSLADEYLSTAHSQGTIVALSNHEQRIEEYHKLVATGLGCLEAVLKNWRLQPRVEALVRLRYARVLFEETDNDLEAETALSKGIDLCERNRMLDLKYSMQQLLARMLHKTNPKASLKAVDGMIEDVEAYRHTAWEYAFRLLRTSLSLSSPSHQDFVSATHHLHKISNLANRNGDRAVSVMSAVIEALAHLQHSSSSDSIEQARRAVAIARSHQLNDEIRRIPQLNTLIQMIDICCSLLDYDINQSAQKLKILQDLMDEKLNDDSWSADGSFSVPLNGKSVGPSSIDTGDILHVQNGTLVLTFNWLPQHDLYALCYFLSAVTLSAKNSYDGRKAEKFLQEGSRMIKSNFQTPQEITESISNATRRVEWRRMLYCNILLQQVFLSCARTDWDLARHSLADVREVTEELNTVDTATIECLIEYAAGIIAQGTGDLKAALTFFQSPLLSLSSGASKTARNDPRRDLAILAALNAITIVRDPEHPEHHRLAILLNSIEPFCKSSPNKYLEAAYYLVCATVHTESTIQTKQFLQQALQSATAISNSQITCITLTFMSWKYFRGVVGEQAEKSARAGRAMAKRANDRLWVSVTDEMLAETLEIQGKNDEARAVREEGQRIIMGLPPTLKRSG